MGKVHRRGWHKYTVMYQPEGDPFTHGQNFDTYEDALEYFNAVKVVQREEYGKSLWIYLTENPEDRMIGGTKLIYYNNIEGDPKNTVDNE